MNNHNLKTLFLSCFAIIFCQLDATVLPINEVLIYRNQATVTRSGQIQIPQGDVELSFDQLPTTLDQNSLQFELGDNIQLTSMDWKRVKNEIEISSEIRSIKDSIALLDIEKKIIQSGLDLLVKNSDLGPVQQRQREEELHELSKYVESRQRALLLDLRMIGNKINQLNKKLNKIRSDKERFEPKEYWSLTIQIVNTGSAATREVQLSYLVSGASWTTMYDLKMSDLDQPLDLEYRGQVINNTGESWDHVQLSLSTGFPSNNLEVGALYPWWLREYQPGSYGNARRLEDYEIEESQIRNIRPKDMDGITAGFSPSSFQEDINVTIFDLIEKKTVPTHQSSKTFTLISQEVEANFYYLARPKITKNIYLIAEAQNWDELMLSQGYVNTFIKGRFQGKSYLNPSEIEDELEFSLGVDRGLSIDRKSLSEFRENKILRTRKRAKRAWQINVRNNKSKAINLKLEDQIPLSASEQIQVENVKTNGGELDRKTGKVTWNLKIQEKSNLSRTLSYEVEFPKDWNIQI